MKRKLAIIAALIMAVSSFTACEKKEETVSVPGDMLEPLEGYEVFRPKTITLMSDTCMVWEDGLQKVCDEYKDKTGIRLEIEKPDHQKYYERVSESFASGNPCDVIEMSGNNYPVYAANGKLWDMSSAWDRSKFNTDKVDQSYIEANRINGSLYGFPLTKGKGSVTYVRKDLLNNGKVPSNYNEFIEMLMTFKQKGVIPYTSSGFINSDTPYTIYLPEFYQNANPDFIQKDGKYVDGMTEPEMREALQRMRDAYAQGLFDSEIIQNNSAAVRNKIYGGSVACTNYWTGYGVKFDKEVKKINPAYEVIPIDPIAEASYVKRQSINFVINNEYSGSDERKIGIFEYFIGYSHDGGEGQLLFSRGAQETHWNRDESGTLQIVDAVKAFYDENGSYVEGYDEFENSKTDEKTLRDLEVLDVRSVIAPISVVTVDTADIIGEIANARKKAINDIVTGQCTIDEGLAQYNESVGDKVQTALNSFNG